LFVYLFVRGLFNYIVSSFDYIAWSGRINVEGSGIGLLTYCDCCFMCTL